MDNKQNIQKIITGCIKKQASAQRALVAQYSDFLYAICCRYMKDRSSAKDQLQKSLLKIFDNIERYDETKGKLESWMSRIAINTCLSDLRNKKLNIVSLDDAIVSSKKVDPEVIETMSTKEIISLVQSLPDIYREIFNLVVIDGYKHKEIEEMLNIKEASSRARLSRAKEMLRNKIKGINKNKSWINLA